MKRADAKGEGKKVVLQRIGEDKIIYQKGKEL